MSFKKIFIRVLILCFLLSLVFYPWNQVGAVTRGIGDVSLHLKAEVSPDNGTTWYNYSGDDNPEGESITINPGDTILLRVKMWNSGTAAAYNVQITGSVTNIEYIDGIVGDYNLDEDGNGREFTSTFTSISISQVNPGGSEESGYESLVASVTICDIADLPVGTTEFLLTVTGISYDDELLPGEIGLLETISIDPSSTVRATVTNEGTTGLTTLPKTGKSTN